MIKNCNKIQIKIILIIYTLANKIKINMNWIEIQIKIGENNFISFLSVNQQPMGDRNHRWSIILT